MGNEYFPMLFECLDSWKPTARVGKGGGTDHASSAERAARKVNKGNVERLEQMQQDAIMRSIITDDLYSDGRPK